MCDQSLLLAPHRAEVDQDEDEEEEEEEGGNSKF